MTPTQYCFLSTKSSTEVCMGDVPKDYYTLPLGKANKIVEGNDITIVTYGAGVHWAMETLDKNPAVSAELIDLRTLMPLDTETIYQSVQKTGKLIIFNRRIPCLEE